MKIIKLFITSALAMITLPALAHVGPAAMEQHFFEHMLIALIIGLPAAYALLRFVTNARQHHSDKSVSK